jgi:cysteinyl-tRNA synthetase
MMSALRLYDTLSRGEQPFVPIKKGEATIYLCGATVQAPPHIGHVRSAINFDILRRWFRNVTDIDDKILSKSKHEEVTWWALAMKYERAFAAAYEAVNVIAPTYEPRATGHVTQMIELMQILIDKGVAYAPGNGDVYLEVRKLKSYLTLSRQNVDDLLSAVDTEEAFKKDPRDFAMWKAAKEGEPSWPTPWGSGRPGWHLECSAMAHTYLGEAFDIHGGGLDLIFPHHENEIAQSQAAGWPFAKLWMHNALVTASGEKMSKSLGNSMQVSAVLERVRRIELRWYLGSAHYRSVLEYSPEALDESAVAFRRIESFLDRASQILGKKPTPILGHGFIDAMNDDLAVPQALAHISQALHDGNVALAASDFKTLEQKSNEIRGALEVLGCDPYDSVFSEGGDIDLRDALDGTIELALQQRQAARARKDFAASDVIRDGLAALGIAIEDTPQGPRWSITHTEER